MTYGLPANIEKMMEKYGIVTLFVVALSLFFDYFEALDLSAIGIPYFIHGLWFYLLGNVIVANGFRYLRTKNNPICPKCKSTLEIENTFSCPNCGKLDFK
ncbi:RNA polymerase subunit RPABC4/transcription elongation factor Spt4 [Methanococcus maripaludis]|uniref:RNA polymerase subunit RPABC4/transcription elongation factor Spt4 n=1 Tax=Methanococcus maripaludis TaxID=39152 RepID=A0A7J9P1Z0_METMI|nr:hypothetical protein [Methanococcus maripaludis]MBA2853942.1 RNA polymerase subunit RPABC4/transcription elongation factor Spt4 [Methanococcus maripaludis]